LLLLSLWSVSPPLPLSLPYPSLPRPPSFPRSLSRARSLYHRAAFGLATTAAGKAVSAPAVGSRYIQIQPGPLRGDLREIDGRAEHHPTTYIAHARTLSLSLHLSLTLSRTHAHTLSHTHTHPPRGPEQAQYFSQKLLALMHSQVSSEQRRPMSAHVHGRYSCFTPSRSCHASRRQIQPVKRQIQTVKRQIQPVKRQIQPVKRRIQPMKRLQPTADVCMRAHTHTQCMRARAHTHTPVCAKSRECAWCFRGAAFCFCWRRASRRGACSWSARPAPTSSWPSLP